MSALRVAYLASEVAPFAKTGGLADVALSLPRALARVGCDVRVFLPLYGRIDRARHGLRLLDPGPIPLKISSEILSFTLHSA